ncbi:MAG: hypothetical protein ACRELB_24925, partial [Polyangiaceae bacterium]
CSSASSGGGGGGGSQSTVPLMDGFDPGPAPDPSQGFQIVTPMVQNVAAGASDEYCYYTNMILPEDTWVSSNQGIQSETGHHIVLYYTINPQPVHQHLCGNDEMGEFQFGMGAGGGAGKQKFVLPSNLAVKLPKGAQIVVNSHYLNASATPVAQAQSAIDVYYADPAVQHVESSMMVVVDTALTVPVGASSFSEDCTVNQTYLAWSSFPHMHNWGTHVSVTTTPASTGVPTQLFDLDWDADYAFDFSAVAKTVDPAQPMVFNQGDKIHIQCDYLNTTGTPMTFGNEMCVFANFVVDPNAVGNMACDGGHWGPI